MHVKYLIFLILNTSILHCAEVGTPRVITNQFVPGIGRSRPWLSVNVTFNQKVTSDFYEKVFQLLQNKFKHNLIGSIKRDNNIFLKLVDKSMTKEAVQSVIEEVNNELLQPETKIKEIDDSQPTAQETPQNRLRRAIINDSAEDVKNAINAGAVINFDESSKSPLLHALLSHKTKAVEALLQAGSNPNITYQGKKLAEYFPGYAILLMKYGSDYTGNIADLLTNYRTGSAGNALIDELVKRGSDLSQFYNTTDLNKNLWYQSISNMPGSNNQIIPPMSFFIERGANVNQIFKRPDGTSWTPLLIAIDDYFNNRSKKASYAYDPGVINELLRSNADVNQKSDIVKGGGIHSPLSYILAKGATSDVSRIIEEVLKKGANLAEAFQLFIKNGGNPNTEIGTMENGNWSLLGFAVDRQDENAVKILLDGGAQATDRNSPYPGRRVGFDEHADLRGLTFSSLSYALKKDNAVIIELLIKHGGHV